MNQSQPNQAGTPDPSDDLSKYNQPPGPAGAASTSNAPTPIGGSEAVGTATRTVESEDILQGAQELFIKHQGAVYRLRRTRNGKLILHK